MDKISKTIGRPKKPFAWPQGRFTINELTALAAKEPDPKKRLTRVALQNKVRAALIDGALIKVASERISLFGRPSAIYEAKCPDPTFADIAVAEPEIAVQLEGPAVLSDDTEDPFAED